MRRMFAFERRWLLALFEAVLPGGAAERLPVGATGREVEVFADDLYGHMPAQAALGLRLATWVLTWFAPLAIGKLGPIGRLAAADRARALTKLHHSPVYVARELPMLVKTFAVLGYGALPHVQQQIGVGAGAPPRWLSGSGE